MDEDLNSLEKELVALRPAPPSETTAERVAAALPSESHGFAWGWFAAGLPAAAALVVLMGVTHREHIRAAQLRQATGQTVASTAAAASDLLKPVAAEKVLYATQDEGVVTLADGSPARRERRQYIDTITWQNPRTHASLTWTLPREEVRVVPVRYE